MILWLSCFKLIGIILFGKGEVKDIFCLWYLLFVYIVINKFLLVNMCFLVFFSLLNSLLLVEEELLLKMVFILILFFIIIIFLVFVIIFFEGFNLILINCMLFLYNL